VKDHDRFIGEGTLRALMKSRDLRYFKNIANRVPARKLQPMQDRESFRAESRENG